MQREVKAKSRVGIKVSDFSNGLVVIGRMNTDYAGSHSAALTTTQTNIVSQSYRSLAPHSRLVIHFRLSASKLAAELEINSAASLEADKRKSMTVTLHATMKISLSSKSQTPETK